LLLENISKYSSHVYNVPKIEVMVCMKDERSEYVLLPISYGVERVPKWIQ
jgi:hypothetical protein